MNRHIRSASVILAAALFAGFQEPDISHYYSLRFLKKASEPKTVTMIMQDAATGRSAAAKKGVIFTYNNRSARKVDIAGSFSSWKLMPMERGDNGIWYFFLPEYSSSAAVKYKFMSDGIWIADPENYAREDDGYGAYYSVAEAAVSPEGKRVSFRALRGGMIEFRTFMPGARYVSLAGDFNNWNPESDPLVKGTDGIWRLKKKVPAGSHRYNFIADGKWLPDLYNEESGSNISGDICSILKVK
jgi:1,4-alpha-glucan branching enzyme